MNLSRYEVYEHVTNKLICVLLATSYADAWSQAERNGWYSHKYYIV